MVVTSLQSAEEKWVVRSTGGGNEEADKYMEPGTRRLQLSGVSY